MNAIYFILKLLIANLLFELSDANSKPRLETSVDRKSQNYGTATKFLCSIQEGTKPFRFEWRKNDRILSPVELPINYRIETNSDDSMLIITKLSSKDSGNYSCTVRNKFGFDTQQTVLIVKGLR